MRLETVGRIAAAAVLLVGVLIGGAASAQPAQPRATLFNRLGCGACHSAPGAGGPTDLMSSAVPRMEDGGKALYDFMRNAQTGHPGLNRQSAGAVIAQLTEAQAKDLVAELRAQWDVTRGQKGRAEAAAIVSASGAPCTVTDATYIPLSAAKKTQVDAYELACQEGLGRVVVRTAAAGRTSYELRDCLSASALLADGKPNPLACTLAANRDGAGQVQPYLAKAGVACELKQARGVGSSADSTYVEAACAGERGYMLSIPLAPAKAVTATSCLALGPGSAVQCQLTPREAMLAQATTPLVRSADASCEVRSRRYMLSNRGDDYYEVACASGAGFVVVADAQGAFKSKVDCDNAGGIDGGCILTDSKAVQTADNALYARLAKSAGYACAVSGYRVVAVGPKERTVEIACADRPDGAIMQAPAAGAPRIFNCAAAQTSGYRCTLSKEEAAYAQLTAAVKKAHPSSTCAVSEARFLGVTPDAGFVEVACADNQPGYVVQYAKATAAPVDALYCSRLGAQLGVKCGLPTNRGE